MASGLVPSGLYLLFSTITRFKNRAVRSLNMYKFVLYPVTIGGQSAECCTLSANESPDFPDLSHAVAVEEGGTAGARRRLMSVAEMNGGTGTETLQQRHLLQVGINTCSCQRYTLRPK